jgi:urease accessory protein
MIAVGLWASVLGGRSRWAVPATFVGVMTFGGILGMLQIGMPFVEQGILASVLVLGLLIAGAVRLPMSFSLALVGMFALFHGHAHGAEMPSTASGLAYAWGFVLSTALLHAAGMGIGWTLQRWTKEGGLRVAGATLTVCGLFFCFVS